MATNRTAKPRARRPLSRERVVEAALALVDEHGVDALSMRTVASALGVEAMSLYRHVASRDDLVLALADRVLAEVEVPPPGTPWREAMRRRALSARDVFLRHPSSAIVVESCATMTPSRLAHTDAIMGLLLADGFDATLAYRAVVTVDSYVYGFTMQELSWPRPGASAAAPPPVEVPPSRFPHFAAVMGVVMTQVAARGFEPSYAEEFRFGLDLVLDALDARRSAALAPSRPRRTR